MKPAKENIYFTTGAAQVVTEALDRCAEEEILTVIVAAPGRGKTEAIKHWSRENATRVRHIRIVCTIRNSPAAMLGAIAQGLGMKNVAHVRMDKSCFAIAERLALDPVMIILDEADMLSLPCMEKLRGIWDEVSDLRGLNGQRAFPLALSGTERLRNMMLRDDLERLHRRVGEFDDLPPLLLKETRGILEKKWFNVPVEDESIAEIHRMARGSFGWLDRIMAIAGDLTAKGGKIVNHRILKATARYLMGLGEK